MEAEEAVEALGEIALVGLWELVGEVEVDFSEETGEMEEPTFMGNIGRGEVEEDLACMRITYYRR